MTEQQVLDADGNKKWYLDFKLHRTDGPAIEDIDGTKAWFQHGLIHRTDGPAVEWPDGTKEWYINDEQISQNIFSWYITTVFIKEIQPC